MKVLNPQQIRQVDADTIQHKPISSINLMEQAAEACSQWLIGHFPRHPDLIFNIVCGCGNNGGDGLAIARQLRLQGFSVRVFLLAAERYAPDCQTNLRRLQQLDVPMTLLQHRDDLNRLQDCDGIVIDALFGSGLNHTLQGLAVELINTVNQLKLLTVSIDLPSGLSCEQENNITADTVIRADYTLCLEIPKLPLLLPENQEYSGEMVLLPIGLLPDAVARQSSELFYTDLHDIQQIYRPRRRFSHKGSFGHALIIAGSYGKIGAAVLAVQGCLRAGAGLVSVESPKCGYPILQSAVPEAMAIINHGETVLSGCSSHYRTYRAVGIGSGIGQDPLTKYYLLQLLHQMDKPMVLDADALNLLSQDPAAQQLIPPHSILTPHPKEWQRWIGEWQHDHHKLQLSRTFAQQQKLYVVLKGAYTAIFCPDGSIHFNSSGNPGMASGGSGDVLTGVLTALLAQGYSPKQSAILGVYLHGYAGDLAAQALSQEGMIAGDLIRYLPLALRELSRTHSVSHKKG
ncbi:NAD(P)H-hydrate dehydratase [Testudinibacter sp. TR-2022]|uniref:NAD(P)H-hydrate dehydratase n=1 Tax=Testudinibacter sp. TR-2022 TaxID=2585029 RepID=UPI0011196772|nr:NAD(P)H-hydrate dehydratase [Testudinibacter sp. TR-2022]TNH05159.1 NAD(P)H-hydrate dehydratase [Pasteurellaceae bacterium Phil31]TNH05870.1 NAD(P)H-hydrate dehydratase [Testudinibacter sp. TR-2022]TNH11149.1 NAD(P)H-hydrate dehydratase [Testudinibacter sp. TR-2022]TNH12825.1 NAD(P)H-hydrate dehydratase [Testudinibacter sp. TR-2022]